MKLNLGCGSQLLEGYLNCDLYNPLAELKCDAKKLPFDDNSIEEIYSFHLIEHFDFHEAFVVLKEWYRVLQEGGKLYIETPDLLGTCKRFINSEYNDQVNLYGQLFAIPWVPGEIHKFLYTETQLIWTLETCGFKNLKVHPALRWIGLEDINLAMSGIK
jgi:predicted SAM-dependent methyltransferase